MRRIDERLSLLEHLGITGYPARVYVSLLDLGTAHARELAHAAGVPIGRIYEVLAMLSFHRLIEEVPGAGPKRYRATAPEALVARELKEAEDRARSLLRDWDAIVGTLRPDIPTAAGATALQGRRAVEACAARIVVGAERGVLGALGAAALRPEAVLPAVEQLRARGVPARLLVLALPADVPGLRALQAVGADLRHLPGEGVAGAALLVADGEALLVDAGPGPTDQQVAGTLLQQPGVVACLRLVAEAAWRGALPGARLAPPRDVGAEGPKSAPPPGAKAARPASDHPQRAWRSGD
ncbi:MAG: hypothetical protein LC624_04280 [Halobacteriales archaeon]|nr:hypothetical protein [Halobacteriales archaeon]